MDILQNKTDAHSRRNNSQRYAHQETLGASVNVWRKETTVYQEATEACLESKKPTSVEMESEAEHEEVLKEEAAVEAYGALKERYGDRHLAVGRRQQLKKRSQGDGGSRKKLAAARRGMTRRAIPAPRMGHGRQGPGRDNVARGTLKGRTFGKRHRAQPEWNNGIRNRGLKE
jgi:hypothetical protein